jgi:hypothetical protein
MSKKPTKPRKTAAQLEVETIAKRANDLEAVSLPADAATLTTYTEVEVTRTGQAREGRKVEGDQARRHDAFSALRVGMAKPQFSGCFDAARRLERDFLVRYGLADHGRPTDRVSTNPSEFNQTDFRIMAAERIEAVMECLSLRDAWLFRELIMPTREWGGWRNAVARITGEENWNAQGGAVRSALVSLRDVYQRLDVAGRRAA